MAAQTKPLVFLVTQSAMGIPAEILQTNGSTDIAFGWIVIEFEGELPAGMLLVDSGAENCLVALVAISRDGLSYGMLYPNGGADNAVSGPHH